jgi:large subunit ribosomal protein L31
MKKTIHPQYHTANVVCACGNTFEVGSTTEKISVEICSSCHPFYTGKQKLIDTAGRVDKFKERMEKAKKLQEARTQGKSDKKADKKEKKEETKKSLKDLK